MFLDSDHKSNALILDNVFFCFNTVSMALTCLVPARIALDTDIIANNHTSQKVAQYIPSTVIRLTDLRPDGVARVVQSTNHFISHFTYFYVLFLRFFKKKKQILYLFVLVRGCRPAAWRLLRLAEPLRALRRLAIRPKT